jgi:hypothetical protein
MGSGARNYSTKGTRTVNSHEKRSMSNAATAIATPSHYENYDDVPGHFGSFGVDARIACKWMVYEGNRLLNLAVNCAVS